MAIFRAKEPFAFTDADGVPRTVHPGDLFDADDPCMRRRAHLFEPVELAASRTGAVEDATAEPGALRRTPRRRTHAGVPAQPEENELNTQGDA